MQTGLNQRPSGGHRAGDLLVVELPPGFKGDEGRSGVTAIALLDRPLSLAQLFPVHPADPIRPPAGRWAQWRGRCPAGTLPPAPVGLAPCPSAPPADRRIHRGPASATAAAWLSTPPPREVARNAGSSASCSPTWLASPRGPNASTQRTYEPSWTGITPGF